MSYYRNYRIDRNQILHNKDDYVLIVGGPNTRQTDPRWRTVVISKKSINRDIPATDWPTHIVCHQLVVTEFLAAALAM